MTRCPGARIRGENAVGISAITSFIATRPGVGRGPDLALYGPTLVTLGPVVRVELERVEALELLAMTFAHLNDAEARGEVSPRVPLLMSIRDRLAAALREEP